MTRNTRELMSELQRSVYSDSFMQVQYQVCDSLEKAQDRFDAVEAILKLMEKHPDADFGTPGPLVHFVETFYKRGYEEKLLESLKRKPTPHTLWMLNRLINDANKKSKAKFVKVLDEVIARTDLDDETRQSATEFRSLH
jgi:hypothetical protein